MVRSYQIMPGDITFESVTNKDKKYKPGEVMYKYYSLVGIVRKIVYDRQKYPWYLFWKNIGRKRIGYHIEWMEDE